MLSRPAVALILLSTGLAHAQSVRTVPTEVPTIQAAIDASRDQDMVRVLPGLYRERIDFHGRAISVISSGGPELTVIDGGYTGTVVRFDSDEGRDSVLEGFTITHGRDSVHAGGVHADGASPTLRNNRIVDNIGGSQGHGISLLHSAALIEGNWIAGNRSASAGHGAGGGGGIGIYGPGAVLVIANRISHNTVSRYSSGGGICLTDAGPVTIVANTLDGNSARLQGGGISVLGRSEARIEQNLLYSNRVTEPGQGGGVQWLLLYGAPGVDLIGNTLANNVAAEGSGVYADGEDQSAHLSNNLILGTPGSSVLDCGDFSDLAPPVVDHNNVVGGSAAYAGLCADALLLGANLSKMPELDAYWRPRGPGAGVDGGNDRASTLSVDLAGGARVRDGNGDGQAHIDIGAFEYAGNLGRD